MQIYIIDCTIHRAILHSIQYNS